MVHASPSASLLALPVVSALQRMRRHVICYCCYRTNLPRPPVITEEETRLLTRTQRLRGEALFGGRRAPDEAHIDIGNVE